MVEKVKEVLTELGVRWEIIVVDDGSTDRTSMITDGLVSRFEGVRLARHPVNIGIGRSLWTGISESSMPWIFYTDCDGQFDLNELKMLWDMRHDADVISGYRRRRRDPLMRLVYSFVYNTLTYILFWRGWKDVDASFKLFRRDIFSRFDLRSTSSVADLELLLIPAGLGYRISQVPVSHFPRRAGSVSYETYRKGIFAWVRLGPILEMFLQLLSLRRRMWRGDVEGKR